MIEKDKEIKKVQTLSRDVKEELERSKEQHKVVNEHAQKLEMRVKQLNKLIEEQSLSKKKIECSSETLKEHMEVLRQRIKVADKETQRYKDL